MLNDFLLQAIPMLKSPRRSESLNSVSLTVRDSTLMNVLLWDLRRSRIVCVGASTPTADEFNALAVAHDIKDSVRSKPLQ